MSGSEIRPPPQVLGVLKDFQRNTVEYVFRRLYLDEPHTRRFLVADEVGLGKTLVARGVIALTLDHLRRQDHVGRLDVVYVCSNGAIAQQNINRLNVTGLDNVALPTRLSLLPLHVKDLEANRVNFVSLTPRPPSAPTPGPGPRRSGSSSMPSSPPTSRTSSRTASSTRSSAPSTGRTGCPCWTNSTSESIGISSDAS